MISKVTPGDYQCWAVPVLLLEISPGSGQSGLKLVVNWWFQTIFSPKNILKRKSGFDSGGLSEPAPTTAPVVDETVLAVLG